MRPATFIYARLVAGLLLLAVIFLIELNSGISGTVGYVLTILFILWFSTNTRAIAWVGVVATVFMSFGFFILTNNTVAGIAINRVLGIITIWLAVFYAYRYRKLSEVENEQKRQLQALFENASEGIIFTNSKGIIVRVNAAAERIFGYEPATLLGKPVETLIPSKLREDHETERKRMTANPELRPKGNGRELPAIRKNGEEFYAEISLSYFCERNEIFYIAFVVDVSERKRQEKIIGENLSNISRLNEELDAKIRERTAELQDTMRKLEAVNHDLSKEVSDRKKAELRLIKSQQLYEAIAHNFPDGVIGVLDRNLTYVMAGGRELQQIGFPNGHPVGHRIFDEHNSELSAQAEITLRSVFSGEKITLDIDLNNNSYNLIAVPLPDAHGEINEILVVMQNITDRKQVERRLIKTIEKEKELSSLKSKFVTMASHEFRTPLTTMLSSVFLLENYTGQRYEEKKRAHFDRIKRSIRILTELMNDFLSLEKLEEGKVKVVYSPVDVKNFLEDIISEFNPVKKPGQNILLEFSGDNVEVTTDRQLLTNIMHNLVSNAIKYSGENKEIRISARHVNDCLKISVMDRGIGIPEDEQRDIFKRFYRAENAGNIQGTGLGLNIVKKYIKLLNGSINFKSKQNEGATFTIRLPMSPVLEKQP